jgi:hypothetical protein
MRRIAFVACLVALLPLLLHGQMSSASEATPGSIAVTVLDESGQPVSGVTVQFDYSSRSQVITNEQGVATFDPAWSGQYQVCWYTEDGSIAFQCWNEQPTQTLANDFYLGEAQHVELSVVALRAGHIVGQVDHYVTGEGVAGAEVVAEILVLGQWVRVSDVETRNASNVTTGSYVLDGLAPGTYRVHFVPDDYGWIEQWSGGASTPEHADTFSLTPGGSQRVDAILMPSGRLSGEVTTPSGNASDVNAYAFRRVGDSWEPWSFGGAHASNRFHIGRVPPGRYLIKYVSDIYTTKWWNDASSMASATEVVVGPGEWIENLDVSLQLGEPDRPINLAHPVLLGKPMVGAELSFDPGRWSPEASGYFPYWFIDGCIHSNMDTVTVTPRMAGHAISLVVYAVAPAYPPSLAAPPIPPLSGYQNRCFPMDQAPPTTIHIPGTSPPLIPPQEPPVSSWPPPLGSPKLTGKPVAGHRLKVVGLGPMPPGVSVTYRWFSDTRRIHRAKGRSLTLRHTEHGTRILCRIRVSKPGHEPLIYVTKRSRRVE